MTHSFTELTPRTFTSPSHYIPRVFMNDVVKGMKAIKLKENLMSYPPVSPDVVSWRVSALDRDYASLRRTKAHQSHQRDVP